MRYSDFRRLVYAPATKADEYRVKGEQAIWDRLQELAPWCDSSDMEWCDEILCGIAGVRQRLQAAETALAEARKLPASVSSAVERLKQYDGKPYFVPIQGGGYWTLYGDLKDVCRAVAAAETALAEAREENHLLNADNHRLRLGDMSAFDWERLRDWIKDSDRKPAHIAFTAGAARTAGKAVEDSGILSVHTALAAETKLREEAEQRVEDHRDATVVWSRKATALEQRCQELEKQLGEARRINPEGPHAKYFGHVVLQLAYGRCESFIVKTSEDASRLTYGTCWDYGSVQKEQL